MEKNSAEKKEKKSGIWGTVLTVFAFILVTVFIAEAIASIVYIATNMEKDQANFGIGEENNNFQTTRRAVLMSTETGQILYMIEGKMVIESNDSGSMNIKVEVANNTYQVFGITVTENAVLLVMEIDAVSANPYAYTVEYYPSISDVENETINVESEETE